MSFAEAVRICLFQKYFEFRGRASRAEYWWFFLFGAAVMGAADLSRSDAIEYLLTGILFLPRLAVTVRRLHDTDRSGWWALLSLVGWIPAARWWAVVIPTLVMLWFTLQKGSVGENRYGPDPIPDTSLGLSRPGAPPPPDRD